MTARRILVLAGRGRYEDPWHDHAATSVRIAQLLAGAGHSAQVRSTFRSSFEDLGAFDLVVVNCGRGRPDPQFDGTDEDWAEAHARLNAYADSGRGLLGVHQAANTFSDNPRWHSVLGGAWEPDRSWHPPLCETTFDPVEATGHPVCDGQVRVLDERYCSLTVRRESRVLYTHRQDGRVEPVVWASANANAIYDGLGHDTRSYDSAGRAALLLREADWLLGAGA